MRFARNLPFAALASGLLAAYPAIADTDLFYTNDHYLSSCPGVHTKGLWDGVVTVTDTTLTISSGSLDGPIVMAYRIHPKPWCFKKPTSCMGEPDSESNFKLIASAENAGIDVSDPGRGDSSIVTFAGTLKLDDDGTPKKLSGKLTAYDVEDDCSQQLDIQARVD